MAEAQADIPSERKHGRVKEMVVPAATATVLSMVGASVVTDQLTGSRDAVLELKMQNWARTEFVTKERSEDRADVLSDDLARIAAQVDKLVQAVPRIEEKLSALDDRVRSK